MITILVLLCLSLLDFQSMPKPENGMSRFVVNKSLDNSATTGCTMSPSQGRAANTMIDVEWINFDDPHDASHTISAMPSYSLDDAPPITLKVMPYDPPGLPDPPDPPPAVVVPEPTAAIITISGLALLYLIFGKKRRTPY